MNNGHDTCDARDLTYYFIRALIIKRTLGTYTAARYLFKRGVTLETALWLLTRKLVAGGQQRVAEGQPRRRK